jgi:hypothetical protein
VSSKVSQLLLASIPSSNQTGTGAPADDLPACANSTAAPVPNITGGTSAAGNTTAASAAPSSTFHPFKLLRSRRQ